MRQIGPFLILSFLILHIVEGCVPSIPRVQVKKANHEEHKPKSNHDPDGDGLKNEDDPDDDNDGILDEGNPLYTEHFSFYLPHMFKTILMMTMMEYWIVMKKIQIMTEWLMI